MSESIPKRIGKGLSAIGNLDTALGLLTGSSLAIKLLSGMTGVQTPAPMMWAVLLASVSGGLVASHALFSLIGILRQWASPSVIRIEPHAVEYTATITLHRDSGLGAEVFGVWAQMLDEDGTFDGPPAFLAWPYKSTTHRDAINEPQTIAIAQWSMRHDSNIGVSLPGGRVEQLNRVWTAGGYRYPDSPDRKIAITVVGSKGYRLSKAYALKFLGGTEMRFTLREVFSPSPVSSSA